MISLKYLISFLLIPSLNMQKPEVGILQVTKIPQLPEPSMHLKQVLDELHTGAPLKLRLQVEKVLKQKRRKRKGSQRRSINGFIAFRTYYSKWLRNATLQQELSCQLGKVWENEPSREIWECYAYQYNETGGDESFIDWLYIKLGLITAEKKSTRSQACKSYIFKNVEDVFVD